MNARIASCLALAAVSLSACDHDLQLVLPAGQPVQVFQLGDTGEHTLMTQSEQHRKLASWVANNRSGWSPCYAMPPAKGIIVRAANLNLQFLESAVFARTPEGIFTKNVSRTDYAFLYQ
jgi:hypothetical protein